MTKIASWIQDCVADTTTAASADKDELGILPLILPNLPILPLVATPKLKPKILVLCGAGVSVAAGIPDFRSPGTGLYDNLQRYKLPYPEAIFDVEYYREKPQAFMTLAKEIWPGLQQRTNRTNSNSSNKNAATPSPPSPPSPTLTHSFLALLEQKGALLRCYTQNIDGLEVLGGVSAERMVECHGHFRTASCIHCGERANIDRVKEFILQQQDSATEEAPTCEACHIGLVKPDIVFFGEQLPFRMQILLEQDLPAADLLIILGTSLQVAPVSTIPAKVPPTCRRVLLNRELVGDFEFVDNGDGDSSYETRDIFQAGDCDEIVQEICRELNWENELLNQNKSTRLDKDV